MFLQLGFLRNPDKSTLLPSQEITYLGFIFNPANILLIVTDDKKEKIQQWCISFLEKESLKIRELASLIGTLTATFVGNKLGHLYYRALDKCKTSALKKQNSNFDYTMTPSKDALPDLKWWWDNVITVAKSLRLSSTNFTWSILGYFDPYTLTPQILVKEGGGGVTWGYVKKWLLDFRE